MDVGSVKTTTYGTETVRNRAPLTWKLVPDDSKESKTLCDFKNKIKTWIPNVCKCNLCKQYLHGVGNI